MFRERKQSCNRSDTFENKWLVTGIKQHTVHCETLRDTAKKRSSYPGPH